MSCMNDNRWSECVVCLCVCVCCARLFVDNCARVCVWSCELCPFLSFLHAHFFVPLNWSPDLFCCFFSCPNFFCHRQKAQREWLHGIKLVLSRDQKADGGR